MAKRQEDAEKAYEQIKEVHRIWNARNPGWHFTFLYPDPLKARDLMSVLKVEDPSGYEPVEGKTKIRVVPEGTLSSTDYDKPKGKWKDEESYRRNVDWIVLIVTEGFIQFEGNMGSAKTFVPALTDPKYRSQSTDPHQSGRMNTTNPQREAKFFEINRPNVFGVTVKDRVHKNLIRLRDHLAKQQQQQQEEEEDDS